MTAASAAVRRGDEPPMTDDETDTGPEGAAHVWVHVPVMVGQVVRGLRPRPGARLVDATVGLGGHAAALLDCGARRRSSSASIAIRQALDDGRRATRALRATRPAAVARSYADLAVACSSAEGWDGADAILLDLGVSSLQLDDAARGFSFRHAGPARHADGSVRRAHRRRRWSTPGTSARSRDAIAELGEEPRARAVARAIVRARPLAIDRGAGGDGGARGGPDEARPAPGDAHLPGAPHRS